MVYLRRSHWRGISPPTLPLSNGAQVRTSFSVDEVLLSFLKSVCVGTEEVGSLYLEVGLLGDGSNQNQDRG